MTEIAIGTLAWMVLGLAFIIFGMIPLKGAPWVPSLKRHSQAALDMLKLKPGQTVIDLGCGDGRFLKQAAKHGLNGVGYELNPFMYAIAKIVTWRCRKRVKIVLGDFWKADISKADAVYVFLFDRYMTQLDDKLMKEGKKGLLLASHTFKVPGRKPAAEDYSVYLYKY